MATKTAQKPTSGLEGNYFHSMDDAPNIHWQGYVVSRPEPGWYLVQLFSWLTGDPTNRYLVRFEQMEDWLFYATAEEMIDSYNEGVAFKYRPQPNQPA